MRRTPCVACVLLGLGGLFADVTGPLLSNFVPIVIRDALGDARPVRSTPDTVGA